MKFATLLLIWPIFLFSCSSKQKNSLKDWNLNGEVKTITNQSYEGEYENGKVVQGSKGDGYKISFNKEGFITERLNLDYIGIIRNRMTFAFKNNRVSEIKTYSHTGSIQSTDIYEYANGLHSKVTSIDEINNTKRIFELKTNNKEQVIEGFHLNKYGEKIGSWKNEFDGGRIKKVTSYDSLGKLESTTIYRWNSKNDLQEINYKSKDYSYTKKYKYYYDNKSNWIKSEEFNEKDSIENINIRDIKYYGNNSTTDKLSNSKLIGIWKETNGSEWIEFKKNSKYDWGSNENIEDMGSYEYNQEEAIISFISNKEGKSKKYKIDFNTGKLIFESINGRGVKVFEKSRTD